MVYLQSIYFVFELLCVCFCSFLPTVDWINGSVVDRSVVTDFKSVEED